MQKEPDGVFRLVLLVLFALALVLVASYFFDLTGQGLKISDDKYSNLAQALKYAPNQLQPTTTACGETKCQSFSTTQEFNGNPLDEPLGGLGGYEEILNRLKAQADAWADSVRCAGNCERNVTERQTITIRPKDPQPGCQSGPAEPFNFNIIGKNCIGNCELAQLDAINQVKDIFKALDAVCEQRGCGLKVTIDSYKISSCMPPSEAPPWYCPLMQEATLHIDGTIQCVGKPKDNKYVVELKVEKCVECKKTKVENQISPVEPDTTNEIRNRISNQ